MKLIRDPRGAPASHCPAPRCEALPRVMTAKPGMIYGASRLPPEPGLQAQARTLKLEVIEQVSYLTVKAC